MVLSRRARTLGSMILVYSLLAASYGVSTQSAVQSDSYVMPTHGSVAIPVPPVRVLRGTNIDSIDSEGGDYNDAQFVAGKTDLYNTWWYQGSLVQQLHSIKPEMKVILYRNVRAIYSTSDEWQQALDNGWILKDSSGNLIRNVDWTNYYLADIGNPSYQNFVANWIKGFIEQYGFGGVLADYGIDDGPALTYAMSGQAVNPRTGQLYTTQEWINDTMSLINKVKAAIGDKLYVGNGINNGDDWLWPGNTQIYERYFQETSIDGFMMENLFVAGGSWYSETSWKNSLDFLVWSQDNFLPSRPRGVICVAQYTGSSEQAVDFAFASCLLGISQFEKTYVWLLGGTLSAHTQALFQIDVGTPTGGHYLVSGTHVYARDFTKVKVLVNPTYDTYAVQVPGQTLTMGPHTGKIIQFP